MSARTVSPRKPREFLLRTAKTIRVHLPRVDFNDIRVGAKREFRNYGRRMIEPLPAPHAVVGYNAKDWWTPENGLDGIDTVLLTLEDTWTEPLGAISEESVAREGFDSLADFRRYFAARYPNGGFRPMANVIVYRIHPMTDEEKAMYADALWERIYGRWG